MNLEKEKIYIAFHKGNKKLLDKVIKFSSKGYYSHVELIFNGFSHSSSGRDNGCRKKEIKNMHFDDITKWDIYKIDTEKFNFESEKAIKLYHDWIITSHTEREIHNMRKGRYDYSSLIINHLLRLFFVPKLFKDKMICTDYVYNMMKSLGLEFNLSQSSYNLSPSNLFDEMISKCIIKSNKL